MKWCYIFGVSNNVLVISFLISRCFGFDTGTVAPLSSDIPALNEKIIDSKDFKKLDTRFNDPPPEFYKGPSNGDSYELKYNGNSYRPHTNLGSSVHINPYLSKHGFYGPINSKDRISIGGGYYSGSEFGGGGYSSERVRPYGSPQPVDISAHGFNSHYNGYNEQGLDWGHSGYGHGYADSLGDKMHHLSKTHFLPFAGAALLGIAAALLVNPVLLQLGTVTGKRRRRRETQRSKLATTPNRKMAHRLAYNGHLLDDDRRMF